MYEKVKKALALAGPFMPASVKALILEIGAEFDRMRADLDELRSQTTKD